MSAFIWLRAEEKPFERRTRCVPGDAAKLVDAGYRVVVEASDQRVIPLAEYAEIDTIEVNTRIDLAVVSGFLDVPLEYMKFIHPTY